MSIAYVNSGAVFNAAPGTSVNFTTGWSPTPGNTLVVIAYQTGTSDFTCADSEGTGNVYTKDADLGFVGQLRIKVFRCTNWQGSGACTITIAQGVTESTTIIVAEYSGLDTSPLDATPVTAQGTAANPTAGSITTIANNCLIIAAFGDVTGNNGTITGNASYTVRQSNGNGVTNFVGAMQDRIVLSPTASADGFTYSAVDHWVAVQVSYKALAPAGVGTSNQATQTSDVAASERISFSGTTDQAVQQSNALGKVTHTNQLSAGELAIEIPSTGASDQATQASVGAADVETTAITATGATDQPAQTSEGVANAGTAAGGSSGTPPGRRRPRSVPPLSPRLRLPERFPVTPDVPRIAAIGSTSQSAQAAFAAAALKQVAFGSSSQQQQETKSESVVVDSELEMIAIALAAAA